MQNKLLTLLIFTLIIWWITGGRTPSFIRKLTQTSDPKVLLTFRLHPPCQQKQSCLVVYVAPWCPACKSMQPVFQTWIKNTKNHADYGVLVVVGQGRTQLENKEMALSYPANSMIDDKNTYHKNLPIEGYPSFVLVSSIGKVEKSGRDAFQWASEELMTMTDMENLSR